MEFLRILAFIAGLAIVIGTLGSAIRTFVMPRDARAKLTTIVFRTLFWLMSPWVHYSRPYVKRDKALAFFAPIGLLCLAVTWLITVAAGYILMFWAIGVDSWEKAFTLSGSSLLTLGFAVPEGIVATIMAFSEATLGLILVALLISYLPTMYSAFSRRELAVTALMSRTGSPPTAHQMLGRYYTYASMSMLDELWIEWEEWFHDVEESHTSLAALPFFRSPKPQNSWVLAACILMDSAALVISTLDVPYSVRCGFCLQQGWLALRHLADFFRLPHNSNPSPTDPISVTKAQFYEAYHYLADLGVPLKPDREQCWRDFAGWRVNYDEVILALAEITASPDAPWLQEKNRPLRKRREAREISRA